MSETKKVNVGQHFCNPSFSPLDYEFIGSIDPASKNPDVVITRVYSDKVTGIDGVAIGRPVGLDMSRDTVYLGGCNNVLIGLEAGLYFTTESNKVIIGDYIRSMDKTQPNVLFLGDNVAIGKTIFGKSINLFDVITEYYNATGNQDSL